MNWSAGLRVGFGSQDRALSLVRDISLTEEEPSLAWDRVLPDLDGTDELGSPAPGSSDLRDGSVYIVRDLRPLLALDVALASWAGRSYYGANPAPGSSPRAARVARRAGRRYLEHVISAEPRRMTRLASTPPCRLADAQAAGVAGTGHRVDLAENISSNQGRSWPARSPWCAAHEQLGPTIREPDLPWGNSAQPDVPSVVVLRPRDRRRPEI